MLSPPSPRIAGILIKATFLPTLWVCNWFCKWQAAGRDSLDLFSSVTQSCLTLCGLMDCSASGLPVYHQLPELTQTHVHRIGDVIQPSHPLLSPSPPAFNLSQSFPMSSVLCIRWPKYWSFSFSISPSNEYSGLISFRMDWLDLLAVQELSRVFSNTIVQKD